MRSPTLRREQLTRVFDHLVQVWEHPDWPLLLDFLASLDTLPANTYDVVVRMAEHPALCAAALLRVGEDRLFTLHDSLERLPFCWHLVPVSTWVTALLKDRKRRDNLRRRRLERLQAAGLEDDDKRPTVSQEYCALQKRLADRNRGLAASIDRALVDIGHASHKPQSPQNLLRQADNLWNHLRGEGGFCLPRELNLLVPANLLRHRDPLLRGVLEVPEEVERLAQEDQDFDHRGLYLSPRLAAACALTGMSLPAVQVLALRRARGSDDMRTAWFDLVFALILEALLTNHSPGEWSHL